MHRPVPGSVVLVGGGPGDPDLLTLGGLRAIEQADVILYDRLAPLESLEHARADAVKIGVGKWPNGPSTPQGRINDLLIEHARAGRKVVRLKGGDAFVFGRGGEEWQACAAAGVPVEVIPGVTSAVAAPAAVGIPVTHRTLSQGFTVVSGHVPPGDPRSDLDWGSLAHTRTTLVILMGVAHLAEIVTALTAAGLPGDTPAATVADAFGPDQRRVSATVATIAAAVAEQGVAAPAITVIGDVAGLDLGSQD